MTTFHISQSLNTEERLAHTNVCSISPLPLCPYLPFNLVISLLEYTQKVETTTENHYTRSVEKPMRFECNGSSIGAETTNPWK